MEMMPSKSCRDEMRLSKITGIEFCRFVIFVETIFPILEKWGYLGLVTFRVS